MIAGEIWSVSVCGLAFASLVRLYSPVSYLDWGWCSLPVPHLRCPSVHQPVSHTIYDLPVAVELPTETPLHLSDWCVFIFNPLKDPNYFVVPLSTWVGLAQQRSFKWTDQQALLFFSFSGGCTKFDILFQQESIPSCVALWNLVTEEKTCRRAFRKQTDISRHPEALLEGRQADIIATIV